MRAAALTSPAGRAAPSGRAERLRHHADISQPHRGPQRRRATARRTVTGWCSSGVLNTQAGPGKPRTRGKLCRCRAGRGDDQPGHQTAVAAGVDVPGPGSAPPHWTPRLTVASLCICLASFQFGYHSGVVNLPLAAISQTLGLDLAAQSCCVSMMVVGGTIGALGCGAVSDLLGRRAALVATSGPILAGTLLCAWSWDALALGAGRFLCGIGVGAASAVAPALVAELSPPASRGLASVLTRVAMVVGILAAYVAAGSLQQAAMTEEWWRNLFTLGALPAIGLAGGLCLGASPESPSWLARQGRCSEAVAALQAAQGVGPEAAQKWVDDEVALGGGGGAPGAAWSELFSQEHRRSLRICCGLAVAQALGGSNAVIYFAATMFAGAGADPGSQAAASIGTGVCNLVGTCMALRLADSLGRKPMLLFSLGGMSACMTALAVTQSAAMQAALPGLSSTVVSFAVPAYILAFGCGVGPLPPLMYSEVFAARVRGKGTSVSAGLNWAAVLLLSTTFLPLYNGLGASVTFAIYAAINAASIAFVQAMVFETKGRDLHEIERELAANKL